MSRRSETAWASLQRLAMVSKRCGNIAAVSGAYSEDGDTHLKSETGGKETLNSAETARIFFPLRICQVSDFLSNGSGWPATSQTSG